MNLKKVANTICCLAVITVLVAPIITSVTYAATSYDQLGTENALGSPILNSNFQPENWNKWEMIVWGIYLSNYVIPFIDDYQSAFDSNSNVGSEGSGYAALNFGSATDPSNEETIKGLLQYAIGSQQLQGGKEIYVDFKSYDADSGKFEDSIQTGSGNNTIGIIDNTGEQEYTDDESEDIETESEDTDEESEEIEAELNEGNNTITNYRVARFKDLFFQEEGSDTTTSLDYSASIFDTALEMSLAGQFFNIVSTDKSDVYSSSVDSGMYPSKNKFKKAILPIFKVSSGASGYEDILDYTDGWDLQLVGAIIAKTLGYADTSYRDKVIEGFDALWKQNPQLMLDCFGNIVVSIDGRKVMIVPSAVNQHLTNDKKVNTLNSLVMTSVTGRFSRNDLILKGQTAAGVSDQNFNLGFGYSWRMPSRNGQPAFGSSSSGFNPGTILLYFDTDTIVSKDYNDKEPDYGEVLRVLYETGIDEGNYNYPLKLGVTDLSGVQFNSLKDKEQRRAAYASIVGVSMIVDAVSGENSVKYLNYLKNTGKDIKLFSDPAIVSVNAPMGQIEGQLTVGGIGRYYSDYLYSIYKNGSVETPSGRVTKDEILNILRSSKTPSEYRQNILTDAINGNENIISRPLASYLNSSYVFSIASGSNIDKNLNESAGQLRDFWARLLKGAQEKDITWLSTTAPIGYTSVWFQNFIGGGIDLEAGLYGRMVKVYPISDVLRSVSNTLNIQQGTEMGVYASYIYLTYLDWYGITAVKGALDINKTHELNMRIFDDMSDIVDVDINSIAKFMTDKQKEEEIRNYTYLMLHPTQGREYRSNMVQSAFTDWLFSSYQKIVHGSSDTYYSSKNIDVANRNSAGFLNISTYQDNFMTSWFMENYARAAIWILAILSLLIVIIGIIKSRKITWFIVSLFMVVTVVLILPATGEIIPYIANNSVQDMFEGSSSYWAIQEGISNAKLEGEYNSEVNLYGRADLSNEEYVRAVGMIKDLNMLFLDRSLMVKLDISRKVTGSNTNNLDTIQQLRSTRWLIPLLLRQVSADDKSSNYVYIPLGDLYDNASNMYWYYRPTDADYVNTIYAKQNSTATSASDEEILSIEDRLRIYPDYIDTRISSEIVGSGLNYKHISYDDDEEGINPDNHVRSYSYILSGYEFTVPEMNGMIRSGENGYGEDLYRSYISKSISEIERGTINAVTETLEVTAGTYDRTNRDTVKGVYGYLLATESPYYYFYQSIKESFREDVTLGYVIGQIQGHYEAEKDDTGLSIGEEKRHNFMLMGNTEKVRDILDLEELITNVVPYLYKMQISMGGHDNLSGVLGEQYITEYSAYKGLPKGWLYRSNWATKIIESPDLTREAIIYDSSSRRIVVENPVYPILYSKGGNYDRPMIFSEAQQYTYGLGDNHLSLIELKMVKVNNEVYKKWTTMLNYANLDGITKEVLFRQMAMEATIIFNREMSPSGMFNSAYKMYPDSIDLRTISFDSVMKMILMNVTKNTEYVYGDTIKGVIETADLFTATLLLIAAFISSYVIPFIRNIVLGLLLYISIIAVCRTLFSDNKTRATVTFGYLVSNIIMIVVTILYYKSYSLLIGMTSFDSVLTVDSVKVNIGNPVWAIIFVLLMSILYTIVMLALIKFYLVNFRDMGVASITMIATSIKTRIQNKFEENESDVSSDGGVSEVSGVSGGSIPVNMTNEKDSDYGDDDDIYQREGYAGEYDIDETMYNDKSIDDDIDKGRRSMDEQ